MSRQLLANLPRFDVPQPKPREGEGQSWLRDLGPEQVGSNFSSDFESPEQDQNTDITSMEDHLPNDCEIDDGNSELDETGLEALNTLNVSLADVIAQLGRDAQEQAIANVQTMAKQLFPKLAEVFLADELACHLPNLIPKLAPEVEISVPQHLLLRLQAAVERTHALPENCRFVEAGTGQSDNAIQIIWPKGGYDFDFNALLADCMLHVNGQAKMMES